MKQTAIKELMRECSAFITEKTKEIYNLMPGEGNLNSRIMFIAPSPSAKEETTGIFFEGASGNVFDRFLEECDLKREDVYLTYAVKYRPYKVNEKTGRIITRELNDEEMEMFYTYLMQEIEIIKPNLIISLGPIAYRTLNGLQADGSEAIGIKSTLTLGDIIYDQLVLPHPSQSSFNKVMEMEPVLTLISEVSTQLVTKRKQEAVNERLDVVTKDDDPHNDLDQLDEADIIYGKPKSQQESPYVSKGYKEVPMADSAMVQRQKSGVKRRKRVQSGKRKVVVVYGGSVLANDPTLVAVERVSSVLSELNVSVKRLDLYKGDYQINAFIEELDEADGVIIATTVEWYGLGAALQKFLDLCFASGRYECFEGAYLFGIVISRQAYERDAMNHLLKSWEILGGVEGVTLCASIENSADLETDNFLLGAIDKKAEDYYRVLNQQRVILPTSIQGHKVLMKMPMHMTRDEGEQLNFREVSNSKSNDNNEENQMSFISNYDEFIEKQQKDIDDIASLFKERLSGKGDLSQKTYPELFEYKYKPDKTFSDCTISWVINDQKNESFLLEFKGAALKSKFGKKADADVVMSCDLTVLKKITEGKLTVQRAFMTGEIKAKGNFTLLYKLDRLFAF